MNKGLVRTWVTRPLLSVVGLTLCAGEMSPIGATPVTAAASPASPLPTPVSPLLASLAEAFQEQSYQKGDGVFLLALYLDTDQLNSVYPGYPKGDGMLIPVGELCNQLELGIEVDARRGLAEGRLAQNSHPFKLDVQAGTVTFEGRQQSFDRSRVEVRADDIYVDSRLLAQWLPLDLKLNLRSATLQVMPRVRIPLQERWQREVDAQRIRPGSGTQKPLPLHPDPYRFLEVPMVDLSLSSHWSDAPGASRKPTLLGSTLLAGDFLGLSGSAFGTVSSQGHSSPFRATLGRRMPDARERGALQPTEFAFGEVLDTGVNLVSSGSVGTGASVSNIPLQMADSFDHHSFRGDLPPGWQVELYRNQALLGFQASRPDGRYEFLNTPLSFGLNDFRLVFYGPQGQRREETFHFDVGTNQTKPGEFHYQFVGLQGHQIGAKTRGHLDLRYGLSKQVAVGASYSELTLDGLRHSYTEARITGFGPFFSTSLSAAKDKLGGTVEELALRSRLGDTDITLQRDELQNGFVSEQFQGSRSPIKNRSSLQLTTFLPNLQKAMASLSIGGQQTQLVSGETDSTYSGRLSAYLLGVNLTNTVTRLEQRDSDHQLTGVFTTGSVLLSKATRNVFLRGQADYDLNGPRKLSSYSVGAETLQGLYNLRLGASHAIAANTTTYQMGISKYQGAFGLGLDVNYSKLSRFSVDFSLRFGLAREPRTGRIAARAAGVASQGAISALTLLDTTGGTPSGSGEKKPVARVAYRANGLVQPGPSDERGVAFLTNLPVYQGANIDVEGSSVEDPAMRAATAGFRIIPRPGHVARLVIPMVILGEVTGMARLKGPTGSTELAGLQLQLVDAQGKVVKQLRTSYDGYYTLAELRPGSYQLRVPEAELKRLALAPLAPRAILIDPTGNQIDGLDLDLRPLAAPAASLKGNP